MDLRPGMRVLDMGCGKAISSIFLAREFGVQVWAADLWISPTENWSRVREAGVDSSVFPIHAEAHTMPFPHGFFDALISIDAYHYFGTSDLYLGGHFLPLVRPGGQIGIGVPAVVEEIEADPPGHLAEQWKKWPDFWSFHSPAWWRRHWARAGGIEVELADLLPDGWRHWADWEQAVLARGYMPPEYEADAAPWIDLIRQDAGSTIGFARVIARRSSEA
jgi:SAM-dependent methyltransferase